MLKERIQHLASIFKELDIVGKATVTGTVISLVSLIIVFLPKSDNSELSREKQIQYEEKYLDAIKNLSESVQQLSKNQGKGANEESSPCPFDIERYFSLLGQANKYGLLKSSIKDTKKPLSSTANITFMDILSNKEHVQSILERIAKVINDPASDGQVYLVKAHGGFIHDEVASKVITNRVAEKFKKMLVNLGVADCRILTYGAGNSEPISKGKTQNDKQLNQRIEIINIGGYPSSL